MSDSSLTDLNRWLVQLVERRGSDLLLVTDAPACIRVDGQVVPIGTKKLVSDEIENAITPALMPHALRQYLETRIADSSYRNTTSDASASTRCCTPSTRMIWKEFCAWEQNGEQISPIGLSIRVNPR